MATLLPNQSGSVRACRTHGRPAPQRIAASVSRSSRCLQQPPSVLRTCGVPCRQQQQHTRLPSWLVRSAAQDGQPAAAAGPQEEEDFDLLSNKIADLEAELKDELKGCSIYLIGMMGTGKTTLGKMLANTLKYSFFDTDNMIELAHNKMPVSDIFKQYGEEYFRSCERQVLKEMAPYKSMVVSTGGGAVQDPMNWSYMHNGIVAWLQGDTQLLARRVVAEGVEKRPLLYGEGVTEANAFEVANAKLAELLDKRTKYYENADVTVSLEGFGQDADKGAPTAVVMYRLLQAIRAKIISTREEREARRQFTIERGGELPSMRVMQSPNAATSPEAAPTEE